MPVFLSYVISFIYLGIYWNNHHHLLQVVQRVDGRVLWANMHLLFWLSLYPFCHRLDGRDKLCHMAGGALWRGAAAGRDRVLPSWSGP